MKNRITACLLAFFVWGFGIHRLYLGHKTSGVFMLLFFWTFIPAIVALFDFWCMVLRGEKDFDKRYNGVK